MENFIKNDGASSESKSTERRGRHANTVCFEGKIYKGLRQLCEEYGLNPSTILNRLRAGSSLEDAINNKRKEIWYNGKMYNTITQITTEYELSYDAVYAGLRKGKTLDEAMNTTLKGKKRREEKLSQQAQPPVVREKIEFDGKKYVNLQELAKDKGIHLGGLYRRISNGYTLNEAVELTKKASREVVYNGTKYKNLKELALELGIAYHILLMKNKGCSSIEKAVDLAIELQTQGRYGISSSRQIIYNGRLYESILSLSKEEGVEYGTILRRLSLGWSIEDAIEKLVRARSKKNKTEKV